MSSTENYLDEPQNTKFKRTFVNFIKELKKIKEDTDTTLNFKITINARVAFKKIPIYA